MKFSKIILALGSCLMLANCADKLPAATQAASLSVFSPAAGAAASKAGIVAGWPDVIVCRAPANKYIVLRHWLRGVGGNTSYGTPEAYVTFDVAGNLTSVTGSYAALTQSDCRAGARISALQQKNYSVTASNKVFPDAILCRGGSGSYTILHQWVRGNRGYTGYGTPGAFINFDQQGVLVEAESNYAALSGSDCRPGVKASALTGLSLNPGNQTLVPGVPDAIVCQSSGGRFNILHNFIRGEAGQTAWGFPGTEVAADAGNVLTRNTATTAALAESNCVPGSSLNNLVSFDFF
jgi:hypothetical protein